MTKTSKNNFGKYFRYDLAKNKSAVFIYALLNFLAVVVPQIIMYEFFSTLANDGDSFNIYSKENFAFGVMKFSIAMCIIMITVTTIKSMRIYHDRAAMDTLGCLPLSYGERFWGDLLSGICANFISLVPFCVVSLILKNAAQPYIEEIANESTYFIAGDLTQMNTISVIALVLIISYLGVYAVTTFISSCCGKFSTSVIFSFVAMAVVPGIYWIYATYFYTNSVGIDMYWEICSRVGMLPPFGWVLSLIMRKNQQYVTYEEQHNFDFLINRPICFIVPILIIAAFLLGAYLVGKKRRAEKTGEGFVFKSVFYILIMTLLVLVMGLTTFQSFFNENKTLGWFVILPLAFMFYAALEISENKGFKGFWKTIIRFSAVVGACVAFLILVKSTNAFDYYKTLPSESSIKEVRVAGEYFFSEYGSYRVTYHTYRSADSVSAILSEHKKLLETEEGLKTGHKLIIDYVTESGKEIRRTYTVEDRGNGDLSIRNFSDTVHELKEFDPSALGVIGGSDFSNYIVEYYPKDSESSMIVRNDKVAELAKILSNDIKNYYFDDFTFKKDTVGSLRFGGADEIYLILNVYEATLEFLNDPANFTGLGDEIRPIEYLQVTYRTAGDKGMLSDITVTVSMDDTNEYAKELLNYIEPTRSINHTVPCFIILDDKGSGWYKIDRENEQAAIKAMLKLLLEANA